MQSRRFIGNQFNNVHCFRLEEWTKCQLVLSIGECYFSRFLLITKDHIFLSGFLVLVVWNFGGKNADLSCFVLLNSPILLHSVGTQYFSAPSLEEWRELFIITINMQFFLRGWGKLKSYRIYWQCRSDRLI